MVIFHSYVSLPQGIFPSISGWWCHCCCLTMHISPKMGFWNKQGCRKWASMSIWIWRSSWKEECSLLWLSQTELKVEDPTFISIPCNAFEILHIPHIPYIVVFNCMAQHVWSQTGRLTGDQTWRVATSPIYVDYFLVGGLEHFCFFHILGIIIQTDFHIFQRGWNHQPVFHIFPYTKCNFCRSFPNKPCSMTPDVEPKTTTLNLWSSWFLLSTPGPIVLSPPTLATGGQEQQEKVHTGSIQRGSHRVHRLVSNLGTPESYGYMKVICWSFPLFGPHPRGRSYI